MLASALFGVYIGGKSASNLCLVFLLVVNMLATSLWCFYWW